MAAAVGSFSHWEDDYEEDSSLNSPLLKLPMVLLQSMGSEMSFNPKEHSDKKSNTLGANKSKFSQQRKV